MSVEETKKWFNVILPHRIFAHLFLLATLLLIPLPPVFSGEDTHETGRFYIRNFGFKEYDAHQQNWGMVQDKRGIVYIGNNWGILEYDGVSWRQIVTDKNATVLALDIDSTGVIYVGAEQGLGYLAPDSTGSMRFISLEDRIPEGERDFADVWRVHTTRYGVYFFTVTKLLLWANHSFEVLPIDAHSYSQKVGDTIYYPEKDVGLIRVSGGAPERVAGGDLFAEKQISTIFQFDDKGSLLLGSRSHGLFVYDGKSFKPFETAADAFLKTNILYSGTPLRNGWFALGTIRGGVAIIDGQGRWLHKLDESAGLRDQTVISCFADRQGALWLSFLNGLARVEITTPFSRFSAETGLESGVESIVRHQDVLYAATHRGVHMLDSQSPQQGATSFKPVTGISGFSWRLFSEKDLLLAATDAGVYKIDGNKATRLAAIQTRAFSFYRPAGDDEHLLVGLIDGLAVLRRNANRWINLGRVQGIDVEIRSITADKNGNLWLGTNVHGAFRVQDLDLSEPARSKIYQANVTQFGEDQLPVGEVNVFSIGNQVLLGTERGIRYFDGSSQIFRLYELYGTLFADTERYVGRIVEDAQNRVWIFSRKEKKRMFGYAQPLADSTFSWTHTAFRRIADVGIIFAIYPEKDGVVWIGGTEGIARFDPSLASREKPAFHAVIRRVTVRGDSVVFGGTPSQQAAPGAVVLKYSDNAMRFEFAATAFEQTSENEYQHWLEGFEASWSPWTKEVKKDYTNLPEHDYQFHLHARNIYGHAGQSDVFEFIILPPWYRSWWAYSIYLLLLALALFGFAKLQMQRYQRKAAAVLQREKEQAYLRETTLRAEAAELKTKAAEAQKEVEKEQIRSRIASDLHDEVGSNLSSIAMISQMLEKKTKIDEKDRQRLHSIHRVARETTYAMRDIVWFVNPANDSLDKLFVKMRETANFMLQEIDFSFHTPELEVGSETDLNFRRNIFLIYKESLQNIVKHSQATHVNIAFVISNTRQVLEMQIIDNGCGFDSTISYGGNGLKNLVRRAKEIGGNVEVRSTTGRGTEVNLQVSIAETSLFS